MSKFFNELKRRQVIKAAIAYLVVAWVLLQVATILLDIFHSPDWVKQAFTIFLIIGLPIWIIISWIYDFTSKGIKKTAEDPENPKEQIISQITGKRLNSFIIVSLIIAVILLIIRPSFFYSDLDKEYSIAVIPFSNIKVDQDKEWLSQNFTQNVNTYLSKIIKLRVIDAYSSGQYKDTDKTNTEIGEELEVSYILRGTLTQINNKLSITVELIDAVSNTVVWSENYDENLEEDDLKLQQQVSQKIVAQLKVVLTPNDLKVLDNLLTINQDASLYFNEGIRIADSRTNINVDSILVVSANWFQKAIDLDPNYADAYAEKAFVLRLLSDNNEIFEGNDKFEIIDSLIKKSLKIDTNTARAYTTLGMLQASKKNWEKAKEYYDKALTLKPNDVYTHHYYALYFFEKQPPDSKKAFENITIAHKLNPFSIPINMTVIMELLKAGKITEAEAFYNNNSHVLPGLEKIVEDSIIDAKIKKECIEKKDWAESINLYQLQIELDTVNSHLYRKLAEAYNGILNDDINYIKYAKKAYELGELYEQNVSSYFFSDNAYTYYLSLLKTERFKEANNLLQNDYFSSLFLEQSRLSLVIDYHYYTGDYNKVQTTHDTYVYSEDFELSILYAQQNDIKKVTSILNKNALKSYEKAIVFAILKERDSMYYYMEKEKDIENVLYFNGSIELDPYRKEDRYKTFLKKNYLPLTQWNE
jgi:TolB-like protein